MVGSEHPLPDPVDFVRSTKNEFQYVMDEDQGFADNKRLTPGEVDLWVSGREIPAFEAHALEGFYIGDTRDGAMSLVRTYAEFEPGEYRSYTEILIERYRIVRLDYRVGGAVEIREARTRLFGWHTSGTLTLIHPELLERWLTPDSIAA